MDEFKYIGWIPCLNGHLDFGLTKVGIKGSFTNDELQDVKCIQENLSANILPDHHNRKIVLQSKVDWRDSDSEDRSSGYFRVFVVAEVNKSDDMDARFLKGYLLLYPLESEPETLQEKREFALHERSHDLTLDNISQQFSFLSDLVSEPTKISGLRDDNLLCSLEFKILPSGITGIKYKHGASALESNSEFIIARQAFYYLKYSVHSHRHHENKEDSLTTITKNTKGAGLRLLCQLKRELTNLGRIQKLDNKIHPTSNSGGIIAYSQSLLLALKSVGKISDTEFSREESRLNNTKSSFESQSGQIFREESVISQAKSKSKIWIGFVLAFILGLSRFFVDLPEDAAIHVPAGYAYWSPILLAGLCFGAYKLIIFYYKTVENPSKSQQLYDGEVYKTRLLCSGIMLCVAIAVFVWLELMTG